MDTLIDFLQREDVKQYIQENITSDINRLVLNPPAVFKEEIKHIAAQILARQKVKGKLDGWATNFDLIMPPPLSIEQASSEVTCGYKKQLITGDHLVDLTGGMGIDFLALSESFEHATYVEKELQLCNVFQHNMTVLDRQLEVVNADASWFLANHKSNPKGTVIYVDPARRNQQKSRVFKMEDCSPNLIDLLPVLKQKANKVLIKYSPLLDIQVILKSLPHVKEVHVVSVKNDCKELLILVDFEFNGIPQIHCINLGSEQPDYTFQIEGEKKSIARFEELGPYLFEPNSSIMKAGAFKKIALDFNLGKLSENTHLYTLDVPINALPGRVFKVVANADKQAIKEFAPEGKINVITRNYPLTANELKKKWKLRDGGGYYLVAFRDMNDKARMVIVGRL
ncbi:MAG: RsmD family RNA methyltransferase [Ekhidna sp.]